MAPVPIGTLPDNVPTLLPLLLLQWLIALDWSTDTEFVNDLYQFTVNNCLSTYCRLCTFTTLAQQTKLVSLNLLFSCIASLLASLMHLLTFLPGPSPGVGEKRRSGSPFYLFARLCLQDPQAGGHLFLGFTPSPRPRVRGPAPTLLNKLGCLPGPVCGVREKKASRALSLSLLLHLLFFTVFTQATSPQESEPEKVLFYLVDCQEYGFLRQLYRRSPQKGEIQKFTCAQVCERNLPRAQWLRKCQVHSVGNGYPSLPTICTHFTDTHCSMTLCHTHSIHWSQSKGSVCPPFSASNCDIPCHDSLRGLYLPISSLSASISQSFCSSLACGASILTTPDLTPKNGSLYLPFSASNCAIRCHDLLHMSNLHGSSLWAFYHDLTYCVPTGKLDCQKWELESYHF